MRTRRLGDRGDGPRPIGIFTTTDLVAVAARGLDEQAVAEVMTRTPFALPAHALAYEAALAMIGTHIRHVLVMDEDRIIGVVSERDLFSLQRLGLGEITTEIRLAGRIELLVDLAAEIRKLARLLVEEGVAAEQLTLFVSVLNDRLCQRIIEIERKNHQWERISWCWLAFGSEGRFEQTFSTDQDNGILFSAHEQATPDAVRARLLPFAGSVNQALDACGFPLCKGRVMASNPKLCLSLEEWQVKMGGWLESPEPKALLDASICFDFRPLYGDTTLAVALREWVLPRTRANTAPAPYGGKCAAVQAAATCCVPTEDARMRARHQSDSTACVRSWIRRASVLAHALPQTNTGERRASRAGSGMVWRDRAMVKRLSSACGCGPGGAANLTDEVRIASTRKLNGFERYILKGLSARRTRKTGWRWIIRYKERCALRAPTMFSSDKHLRTKNTSHG